MSALYRKAKVRTRGAYIEIAIGPDDDDWQLRAVQVGKGIEIITSRRFNAWAHAKVYRKWCKKVAALAAEIEALDYRPAANCVSVYPTKDDR